jgi:hypothetical protein
MGNIKTPYNILAENPTGKKPLGNPWCGWEIIKEISLTGLMWLMMVSNGLLL